MPIDRGIIDQQLLALGEGSRWWNQRELRDLPAVLHADEEILAISRGKIARLRWLRRPWLIVVTQKRLLCLRSSGTSWRQFDVGGGQISRVALRIGLFRGRVLVVAGGHTYRLLVPRVDAYKLQTSIASIATPAKEEFSRFAPTRMVHRVIDHVLSLPAVALNPNADTPPPRPQPENPHVEARLQMLEQEVHELREQVDFLEQLLRQRHPSLISGDEFPSS